MYWTPIAASSVSARTHKMLARQQAAFLCVVHSG